MAVDVHHIGGDLDLEFSDDFDVREEAVAALRSRIHSAPIGVSAALENFTATSDDFQARVIEAQGKTIRLVAPAGSGKTQTMVNRVLSRIRDGVAPGRVILLTFDRSAAGSLEQKLSESMDRITGANGHTGSVDQLTITTLNAFGYRLLREFAPDLRLPLITSHLQQRTIRACLELLGARSPERFALLPKNLQRRYYLEVFSFLKNQIQDPRNLVMQEAADLLLSARQASAFFEDHVDAAMAKQIIQAVVFLYRAYDQALVRDRVMDFDDQKLRSYVVLRENPGILSRLQSRYDEVIVDEFQDINKLDFELIKLLAAKATLIVTGDDDQAIYGFRGCSPDYIIDLEEHLGRSIESHELSINYRSPSNIVAHADQLIRHNTRRIIKNPRAYQQKLSTISVVPTLSSSLEAKSITEYIKATLYRNPDLTYGDIAVLYRTNAQSLPMQIEFILSEVPFFVRDEDNLLENESLARLLSVLRAKVAWAASKPIDSVDQVNVVKAYFRYVDNRAADRIRRSALSGLNLLTHENAEHMYQALPKARESNFIDAFYEIVAAKSLDDELDVLRRRFSKGLQGMVGSLEDAVEQRAPLAEVFDMARDYNGQTHHFLATMDRAMERAKKVHAGRDEKGVALLTYFKSKGRQWHTVILTSCNEGLIPHSRAPIEEERRLFYVALTRPSCNLMISYVQNACDNKVRPSRFLFEAGLLRADPNA